MKIGKPKPPGIAGVKPVRKKGDPKPSGYVFGKPTSYRPEYCQAIVEYFDRKAWEIVTDDKGTPRVMPCDNVPTFERWARAIGIEPRAVLSWRDKYPEFGAAYEEAKGLQRAFLIESGLTYGSGSFAVFMLKCNHGMSEPKADIPVEDGPIQKVVVEVVGANQHKGD